MMKRTKFRSNGERKSLRCRWVEEEAKQHQQRIDTIGVHRNISFTALAADGILTTKSGQRVRTRNKDQITKRKDYIARQPSWERLSLSGRNGGALQHGKHHHLHTADSSVLETHTDAACPCREDALHQFRQEIRGCSLPLGNSALLDPTNSTNCDSDIQALAEATEASMSDWLDGECSCLEGPVNFPRLPGENFVPGEDEHACETSTGGSAAQSPFNDVKELTELGTTGWNSASGTVRVLAQVDEESREVSTATGSADDASQLPEPTCTSRENSLGYFNIDSNSLIAYTACNQLLGAGATALPAMRQQSMCDNISDINTGAAGLGITSASPIDQPVSPACRIFSRPMGNASGFKPISPLSYSPSRPSRPSPNICQPPAVAPSTSGRKPRLNLDTQCLHAAEYEDLRRNLPLQDHLGDDQECRKHVSLSRIRTSRVAWRRG